MCWKLSSHSFEIEDNLRPRLLTSNSQLPNMKYGYIKYSNVRDWKSVVILIVDLMAPKSICILL